MKITRTEYFIRLQGESSYFPAHCWSGYSARLALRDAAPIPAPGEPDTRPEVYGPEQAMEHVEELRKHVYFERKVFADKPFEIVRRVVTEEVAMLMTVNMQR